MKLTDKQYEAINLMLDFINDPSRRVFILDGFAGTGKSTTLAYLIGELKNSMNINIVTYTGKASLVLQSKGIEATTIHSFLYNYKEGPEGEPIYQLKESYDTDLIIVDESSFISDDLYRDLLVPGAKIIYIGDSYQLSLNRTNKLDKYDYQLNEVLRFALESRIMKLATEIREKNRCSIFKTIQRMPITNCKDYDVIICYTNKVRAEINQMWRKRVLNIHTHHPQQGEKIIFLQNFILTGVINGLIIELEEKPTPILCIDDRKPPIYFYKGKYLYFGEKAPYWVLVTNPGTPNSRWIPQRKKTVESSKLYPVDFAYCLTGHKAQGSEWDKVLVLGERLDDPHFMYTSVTRARKEVDIVLKIVEE